MGDRILSVNAVDIRNASHHDAVQALLEKKDRMKLKVQHDPLPSGFREVRIEKRSEEKLGMVIKGGLQGQPGNPLDPADEGVFISKVRLRKLGFARRFFNFFNFQINPGGVASTRMNELVVGQRIIEVNGKSLLGATHAEAVEALRSSGDSIHLLLCDGWNNQTERPELPAVTNGNQENQEPRPPRPNSAQEVSNFEC